MNMLNSQNEHETELNLSILSNTTMYLRIDHHHYIKCTCRIGSTQKSLVVVAS